MQLVAEALPGHPSERAAIESVAGKIGASPVTVRKWVRQAQAAESDRMEVQQEELAAGARLGQESPASPRPRTIMRGQASSNPSVTAATSNGRVASVDLREYLRILRRRWQLIVVCVLATVAAVGFFTLRATPLYASTSTLFISTPSNGFSDPYSNSLFSQERVASYAELIAGEDLAERVVETLDLATSPAAVAGQITSTTDAETVLLDVTVTDPVPARAQLLADAVASEFTTYVAELETSAGQKRSPVKATIVDSADLPTVPSSPQPLRNFLLAGVLGLLLGVGLAILREVLDTTIKTAQDCAEATGTALLGSVRFDAKATKNPLVTDLDPHAPRVETFRMLRTNLQFVDVDNRSRVFVVTSAVPGEGKSTTAINLAITLAQAQQKVLLIEADLRRPKVSSYLHLEPTVGLTTVLIGSVNEEEATQHWGPYGLDVITSGVAPPNPAEIVQSRAMHDTLARLRLKYDVIIIDAPPLLPVTDAALLATQADGAILVVRYGKTTKAQGAAAAQRLVSVDAKILGSVLNMTPERGSDVDGYGYGYGYSYAPTDDRPATPAPVTSVPITTSDDAAPSRKEHEDHRSGAG